MNKWVWKFPTILKALQRRLNKIIIIFILIILLLKIKLFFGYNLIKKTINNMHSIVFKITITRQL